jgi:GTP-binding protein
MFVDEVVISVKAGDGGSGCVAFRREKFIPRGGPSGGDGGNGGNVIFRSSHHHNTLLQFRFKPIHEARRGRNGEGSNRSGKSGNHLVLEVPAGTVVFDAETEEKLFDFTTAELEFIVARGGTGGRGNARFASSTNQAPRRADPGATGESRMLRLELKLLADVGLIGFPNVGKSTLIARISAAHPKIANYPFTTLEPNLGVVAIDEYQSFLVADIPGLIEGAHKGQGLGTRFLRHIERTSLLCHLIDISDFSDREPVEDFKVILGELEKFSSTLAKKPMVVVASKVDASQTPERETELESFCTDRGISFFRISAVTGEGIDKLTHHLGAHVATQRYEIPERLELR